MGEDTNLDSDDDSASYKSTTEPPSDRGIHVEDLEKVEDDDSDSGSEDDSSDNDGNDDDNDDDENGNENENDNGKEKDNGNHNDDDDHDHEADEEEEDYEDGDEDDDKPELACPFCLKFFDAVGMFCHIDDFHPTETKSGICPVCDASMGTNMAAHVTTEHKSILHRLYKKKLGNGDTGSILSSLRKELQDGHLQSLPEESSEPDPLLSSFIFNPTTDNLLEIIQPSSATESSSPEQISNWSMLKRNIELCPFSDKDQEENSQRREFLKSILISTMLDDNL